MKKTGKMSLADFNDRIIKIFPKEDLTILEYNGAKQNLKIRCNKCKAEYTFSRANMIFHKVNVCKCQKGFKDFHDKIRYLSSVYDFEILEERKATEKQVIKCKKCGLIMERGHKSIMATPWHCDNCDNFAKGRLVYTQEEAQEELNNFKNEYTILEYKGKNEKALIKHKNCGKIFTVCCFADLLNGRNRGCPVCYQMKSAGEQRIAAFLDKNKINYIPQKTFTPLNKSKYRFDFYIPNLNWAIEYQGEQHYMERSLFKDDLNTVQKRDMVKREYCKNNNIKLFEISYKELKNIEDILTSMFNDYLEKE